MQTIPKDILDKFDAVLKQQKVAIASRNDYRKWLRYFLDFCAKYQPPNSRSEQARLFIEKLRSKNQSAKQLEQAADAVSLFFTTAQPRKKPGSENAENTGLKPGLRSVDYPSPMLGTGLKGEKV